MKTRLATVEETQMVRPRHQKGSFRAIIEGALQFGVASVVELNANERLESVYNSLIRTREKMGAKISIVKSVESNMIFLIPKL